MLIRSCYLSGAILLVQSVLCNGLQRHGPTESEKTAETLEAEPDIYRYNHPPLSEVTAARGSRKEKSIVVNENNASIPTRTRSRGVQRRRPLPKVNTTPTSEIPVKVLYDKETTTVRSETSSTMGSLLNRTTRLVKRRRVHSNGRKKINIRQTTDSSNDKTNVTENAEISANNQKSDVSSTTEFPKRLRDSYFKKRTEPAPRVQILEQINFVFSHSGNFHNSYLGGDGTKVSSQGQLKSYDNSQTAEAVSGSVFYTDKDGSDFSLTYTADENGYRPVGAHLPTPPPLPPAIARALKYIADKRTTTLSPTTTK